MYIFLKLLLNGVKGGGKEREGGAEGREEKKREGRKVGEKIKMMKEEDYEEQDQ